MTKTTRRAARQTNGRKVNRRKRQDLPLIDVATISRDELRAMADAGCEVLECQRVLAKGGSNVVAEVLPRDGPFTNSTTVPRATSTTRKATRSTTTMPIGPLNTATSIPS